MSKGGGEGLYPVQNYGVSIWELVIRLIFIPAILYYILNRYVF
jgi:hypothetical protein